MIRSKGFSVNNIDSTIFAEAPRLSPYKEEMKRNIARTLQINPDQVNIKATTAEGVGLIGKGEGIAAMCIVLMN